MASDLIDGRTEVKEFLVPTSIELERLIHMEIEDCPATDEDQQNKEFAHLLNQGSSLE
jgi:hypothetical protein